MVTSYLRILYNIMGKVFSMLTRPVRNFNVESRAHKIINKEKPIAAPLHKSNLEEAERLLRGVMFFDMLV